MNIKNHKTRPLIYLIYILITVFFLCLIYFTFYIVYVCTFKVISRQWDLFPSHLLATPLPCITSRAIGNLATMALFKARKPGPLYVLFPAYPERQVQKKITFCLGVEWSFLPPRRNRRLINRCLYYFKVSGLPNTDENCDTSIKHRYWIWQFILLLIL